MEINFDKSGGLVPAIIQDATTKNVLMLGFMNKEALDKTLASVKSDCDNDTLLVRATPDGPTCHKGTDTCWGEENAYNPIVFLSELQDFIDRRREEMPEGSYTTALFNKGLNRIAQKVGEEAVETVIEATTGGNKLVDEASDLLYHLIVLLASKGLRIEDLAAELLRRHNPDWDKARRKAKADGTYRK